VAQRQGSEVAREFARHTPTSFLQGRDALALPGKTFEITPEQEVVDALKAAGLSDEEIAKLGTIKTGPAVLEQIKAAAKSSASASGKSASATSSSTAASASASSFDLPGKKAEITVAPEISNALKALGLNDAAISKLTKLDPTTDFEDLSKVDQSQVDSQLTKLGLSADEIKKAGPFVLERITALDSTSDASTEASTSESGKDASATSATSSSSAASPITTFALPGEVVDVQGIVNALKELGLNDEAISKVRQLKTTNFKDLSKVDQSQVDGQLTKLGLSSDEVEKAGPFILEQITAVDDTSDASTEASASESGKGTSAASATSSRTADSPSTTFALPGKKIESIDLSALLKALAAALGLGGDQATDLEKVAEKVAGSVAKDA
jgi:uncharacterized protein Smg (DUF494 family)